MNLRNILIVLTLSMQGLPALAEILPVSEEEQTLLGIDVRTVTAVDQGGAGEITMRVSFAVDGEWVIKTPLSGVLQRVFVQQGDNVKTGDALVVVRSAEMVALQRDFLKAHAELNLQDSVYLRDKKLSDAGSISDRRWQETRFKHDTARAEYAGLRGQLMLAGLSGADLKQLANKMEISPDIILRSPADAVVLSRPAMLGDQLNGSELLVSLGETGRLMLTGNLSRSAAANLLVGSQIELKGSSTRAELVFVSSVIDPQSQTVTVRAKPSGDAVLKPGQLTSWDVLSDGLVITVPSSAVVKLDGKDVVYLSVSAGFEVRNVDVKSTGSGSWIVLDGLESGDRIAVAGTAVLKGMSMGIGGGDE